MSLGGNPYALDLAAVQDPTGDQLVTTEVTWGDSGTSEVPQEFAAQLVPTHYYQSPGTYAVTATVVDEDGDSNPVPYTTTVNVVFDATSVSPGSAYAINQGQGVSLVGAAAGSPTGFEWIVNGKNAGAGTAGAFNSQTESVSDSLNLTWAALQSLGVTGKPGQNTFNVELSATYAGAAAAITWNPTILLVTDVGPTAAFTFAVDPGVNDTHTVKIAWGDSSADLLSPGTTLAVTTPGTGYSNASGVQVTGGSGTGMTLQIATTSGAITGLQVSTPGTGYKPGDVLTVNRGSTAGNAKLLLVGIFNATTRTFSAVHSYNGQTVSNPVSIAVTVADNGGAEDQKTATAIAKGAPTQLTWSNPATISYGTPLSSTQLNASDMVPGTFVYNPPVGTVLHAGTNQTLSVSFTPTDTVDYLSATATVSINVSKVAPVITWTAPAPLRAGQALSATQLDASTGAAGTFVYSPALGTVLHVGTNQTLSVTFTPTDTTDYADASDTVTISVAQATPRITWASPASITHGTPLGASQLDATASVPGKFTYSPAAGTVLGVGSQTLSVTFRPTDAIDFNNASNTVTINVAQGAKTTPTITWANPAAITYGTALGASLLDATASVPGKLTYSPVAGTVLGAGNQTLSVTFTPTDSTDYSRATDKVTVNVETPPPPTPVMVIGEQAVFQRKLKKGKPVGKPVLVGYMLDLGAPLNPTAANRANFQVATMTTKKVKKKVTHILKPITNFTVSYVAATDAVDITFSSAETFPTGGQITVLSGVTSATGGALAGTTKFTIAPKGTRISPE